MVSLLPYRDAFFAPVEDEFNRLFDRFFGNGSLQSIRGKTRSGYPKLDVLETDKEYVVEVEIPGVDPDALKVEIVPVKDLSEFGVDIPNTRRVLRLSGKKDYGYQYPDKTTWHIKELRRSQFVREMVLPEHAQGDPAATYERGILKLVWLKPEPVPKAEPRLIPIAKKA